MYRDLLYALRTLRRTPAFFAVAVLTLALGIGANAAIFSVVNALLLRSLPLPDPGRLVILNGFSPQRAAGYPFSVTAYENLRDHSGDLAEVAAYNGEGLTLTGAGDPERISIARVSPNFFAVLGVHPVLGRDFQPAEGEPGAPPVAILSHRLWQRRFASDPEVAGKPIILSQRVYTIAGVTPSDFPFPYSGVDAYITSVSEYSGLLPEQIRNGAGFLTLVARTKPGVTLDSLSARFVVLEARYRADHPSNPDAGGPGRVNLQPLQQALVGSLRPTLLMLSGAVAFVLLIACANVAGLLLARAAGRSKEVALRAALGAGRSAIVRQLLIESLLLASAGALGGTLLARWCASLLAGSTGLTLPGFQPVRVDGSVLAFTAAISLLTGILFGLVPALHISRPDLAGVLRDAGRGNTGGARRLSIRGLLVTGQMALSIVLLIGAGLLLETMRQLQAVDPGFDPGHAITMDLSLPPARYPDDPRRVQFVRELVERIEDLPGVRSAAVSMGLPMNIAVMAPLLLEGQAVVPLSQRPLAVWTAITPDYFKALGIHVLRGREFTASDDAAAPARAIVSQSLAQRFWPNQEAIGKHITYARRQISAEIVGVAADVKTRSLDADNGMVFYTPYPQFAWPGVSVTVRTSGPPAQLANAVRSRVLALDRDLPVANLRTLEEMVGGSLSTRRQIMYLVAGFAGIALLLAVVGLYGVMSYSVAQRTAEIGIRQAIGARRADILRMVLGQGLRLSLGGIGLGAVASYCLTRLIANMLYHVSATDPRIFAVISATFLVVALAAAYIPAWKATRVDPATALRQ